MRQTALGGELTMREEAVLALLEEGASTLEIARTLAIAPSTVKDRLNRIYAKAGAANRLELLAATAPDRVDLSRYGLTAKQQEVARLMLAGNTNPAIAQKLYVSRETVRRHLNAIYRKLDVCNRYEAMTHLTRAERDSGAT